jgi:hypothetical protein
LELIGLVSWNKKIIAFWLTFPTPLALFLIDIGIKRYGQFILIGFMIIDQFAWLIAQSHVREVERELGKHREGENGEVEREAWRIEESLKNRLHEGEFLTELSIWFCSFFVLFLRFLLDDGFDEFVWFCCFWSLIGSCGVNLNIVLLKLGYYICCVTIYGL